MAAYIIDRMAPDLGITQFHGEPVEEYESRVAYSAMASWIKAIALDQPIGSKESGYIGVSRRHVFDSSRIILEKICGMCPELGAWFSPTDAEEHPVIQLRTRLLQHGDLINEGFDTNVALSKPYSRQIAPGLATVYGEILNKNYNYSGIALIHRNDDSFESDDGCGVSEWFADFLKELWWTTAPSDMTTWQYYNPIAKTRNTYSAWQESSPNEIHGVVLARNIINKYGYEYYLLKQKGRLIYKLDPFLHEQGYHRRIMFALRAGARNNAEARICLYDTHVDLHLYSYLPQPETMLLECYAWPKRHMSNKLEWTMPTDIWDFIKPRINGLGINIVEANDGQIWS